MNYKVIMEPTGVYHETRCLRFSRLVWLYRWSIRRSYANSRKGIGVKPRPMLPTVRCWRVMAPPITRLPGSRPRCWRELRAACSP